MLELIGSGCTAFDPGGTTVFRVTFLPDVYEYFSWLDVGLNSSSTFTPCPPCPVPPPFSDVPPPLVRPLSDHTRLLLFRLSVSDFVPFFFCSFFFFSDDEDCVLDDETEALEEGARLASKGTGGLLYYPSPAVEEGLDFVSGTGGGGEGRTWQLLMTGARPKMTPDDPAERDRVAASAETNEALPEGGGGRRWGRGGGRCGGGGGSEARICARRNAGGSSVWCRASSEEKGARGGGHDAGGQQARGWAWGCS